ncbi:MarR family winged helix-turn-helix transcriptional regulator [Oscillibacter sp.]|uniref:MarR family winged helix-turn-helix transcriptional regulator n=1 Tax=Oscillibacter sp. TaxID=1945593 RepID=UPI002638652D|nr:MarR family transcriptional regulator [Oscillibacter sp.]MDD3346717.1 MarR family transcriptional regulator [Oscillibacter sp.]
MEHLNAWGPLLGRTAHLARERMEARLSHYDVTPAQTHVLLYLYHHGGQAPQCEVTEYLKVRPPTANGILDRMEEKGLVERSVSGKDARRRLITLTDKGREQQANFRRSFQEAEAVIVRGISPEALEALRGTLEQIIQNLEEDRTIC